MWQDGKKRKQAGEIPVCFFTAVLTEGLLTLIAATAQLLRDMRTEVFSN